MQFPPPSLARCTLVSAALMAAFPPTRGGRGLEMLASSVSVRAAEPTIGAAIEGATSAAELLSAASCIPSPYPPFAAPYLADDVHQRRRQRLACNCLQRLSTLLVGSGNAAARRDVLSGSSLDRLFHLTACAAASSRARADGEDPAMDVVSARETVGSLAALATLCGETAAERSLGGAPAQVSQAMEGLRNEAVALASRAESLEPCMDLAQACAARDATRRLLGPSLPTPRLDRRVAALPFEFCFGTVALPPPVEGARAVADEGAQWGWGASAVGAEGETKLRTAATSGEVQPLQIPGGASGGARTGWGEADVRAPEESSPRPPASELLCLQSLLDEIPFCQEELLTADGQRWGRIPLPILSTPPIAPSFAPFTPLSFPLAGWRLFRSNRQAQPYTHTPCPHPQAQLHPSLPPPPSAGCASVATRPG
jgi:hypothetical protein